MNNVKAREEDYSTLKDLESRLQGLPADFHIAIRERKLLRQGSLCCVSLNDRDQEALNSASAPATPRSSPSISSPILTGSSRAQFDGVSAEGMSKLMPITNSDFRPLSLVGRNSSSSDPRSSFSDQAQPRSGRDIANDPGRVSLWSNASSFSAASFASDASRRPSSSAASHTRPNSFVSAAGSESSASMYEQPQRPASRQRSAGPESLSPQLYSLPSSLPSPTLSRRPSMASILLRNSSKHEKEREREMNIQAFVFSDILVLCTLEEEEVHAKQSKSSKKNKMASSPQLEVPKPAQKYNVLEGVGIGRVLSVTDHSGKLAGECLKLTVSLIVCSFTYQISNFLPFMFLRSPLPLGARDPSNATRDRLSKPRTDVSTSLLQASCWRAPLLPFSGAQHLSLDPSPSKISSHFTQASQRAEFHSLSSTERFKRSKQRGQPSKEERKHLELRSLHGFKISNSRSDCSFRLDKTLEAGHRACYGCSQSWRQDRSRWTSSIWTTFSQVTFSAGSGQSCK